MSALFSIQQIWKEHKRICGKRSFEWPTLNAEEQKEMWELRNVEYGALEGRGAIWAEQLEEAAVAFKMISREASDNSNSPQQRRDIIFMVSSKLFLFFFFARFPS
jgi:hypothetical protein